MLSPVEAFRYGACVGILISIVIAAVSVFVYSLTSKHVNEPKDTEDNADWWKSGKNPDDHWMSQ